MPLRSPNHVIFNHERGKRRCQGVEIREGSGARPAGLALPSAGAEILSPEDRACGLRGDHPDSPRGVSCEAVRQGLLGEIVSVDIHVACAIEEDREPENSARNNLASLQLCFAAVASAESGQPVDPADVQTVPDGANELP